MARWIELDEKVPLAKQGEMDVGPVVLINRFTVAHDEADRLLAAWAADARFFLAQPGAISTQLHRGVGGSCVFLNYAVWATAADYTRAFRAYLDAAKSPEAHGLIPYPPSVEGSPHLFEKVAVPGVCEG